MDNTDKNSAENFKNVTSALMRTLAGDRELEVSYSSATVADGRPARDGKPRLPAPTHNMPPAEKRILRGCADAQALYIAHHDERLHHLHAPKDARSMEAFDALEQARCEALGARNMAGVGTNLHAALEEHCRAKGFANLTVKDQVGLGDALHVMARMALTGEDAPPSAAKMIKLWKPTIEAQIEDAGLESLASALSDQAAFAALAKKLIRSLNMPVEDGDSDSPSDENDNDDNHAEDEEQQDAQEDDSSESSDGGEIGADDDVDGHGEEETSFEDHGESDEAADSGGERSGTPQKIKIDHTSAHDSRYMIFTMQFDETIDAHELAEPSELSRLRKLLDTQLASHQTIITKLANRLQRKVMAQQQRSWSFDQEEGILDATRLSRIIANPNVPLSYKQEKETEFRDTVVTILIDNSGSMRGRPIALAAMSADIIAQTLERCGVKCEILGFTTRAWKGGKSREAWLELGKPPEPGRLNDIRHIIYKAADAPMRRTRRNLGLMLKEGILKENIDGEALVWAHNRLSKRGEARKILMVISDGAPVDDSTLSANPSNMLEDDLRHVIHWIENTSKVQLTAIGIGHDVTRYYKRAMTIANADELAKALIGQLAGLFDEKG